MKYLFILSAFLLCAGKVGYAQFPGGFGGGTGSAPKIYDGKISGTVVEKNSGRPIEFANVALFEFKSEKPADGAVTDEKGFFRLKNIKNGKYRLTVTFIGFETRTYDSLVISDKQSAIEIGRIELSPGKELEEVDIVDEKPLIETRIDKLVYNADKDLTSKGGNATDVLRKVPMVSVDLQGNVMLQGTSNVRILINDKPSGIMAGTVADAMKMIPADEIEKVEVITSPSAKYDAEGTGGIINIITKRKTLEGISGMLNLGLGTRSSNLFGNINYRKNRFGTGLNLGGFAYHGRGDLYSYRSSGDTVVFLQNGDNTNTGFGPLVQWTTDLDLNSRNNISTSIKFFGFFNSTEGVTDTRIREETFKSENDLMLSGINYDASVDYKKKFTKPEQEFSLSAQRTKNDRTIDYDIHRVYENSLLQTMDESSVNDNMNTETTFQTDYVHPFSKKLTLETGAKSIFRNVTSESTTRFSFNDSVSYIDPSFQPSATAFNYFQDIFAGYALGSLSLKKFGVKAGIRFEQTEVDADQGSDTSSFSSSYSNWIPSITLSYRKAGKYQLKVSYTQRIQRPGMTFLNPYRNSSDQTNTTYGNPGLDAETSHAFEFGYSLFRNFGSVTTNIYYRFTNNAIEKYSFVNNSSGLLETTYGNIGNNRSTGANVNANIIYKKTILNLNANIFYYEVETSQENLSYSNSAINYSLSLFGMQKFNERWGIQAFGSFSGPKYTVQGYTTSFFYYNLSGRFEFKNGKGGIGLGLDNFASPYLHFKTVSNGEGFRYVTDNKITFFGIRLSIDYRFGKMEFGGPKKKIRNDDLKPGDEGGMEGGMGGGR